MPARNHSQDRTSLVPIVLSAIAVFKQNARAATVATASSQPRDMVMNQLLLICRSSGDRGSGADGSLRHRTLLKQPLGLVVTMNFLRLRSTMESKFFLNDSSMASAGREPNFG